MRQGDAQLALGKLDDALATYKESSDLRLALVDAEPKSVAYRRSFASCSRSSPTRTSRKAIRRRDRAQEQALAIRTSLVAEAPAQGDFKNELASTEIELGKLLVARDPKRAGTLIASGLARARALIANDPDAVEWKETLTQGLLAQGLIGDPAARKAAFDEARETSQRAVARSPQNVVWPGYLAEAYIGLGDPAKAHAVLEPLAKAGRLPAKRLALLR